MEHDMLYGEDKRVEIILMELDVSKGLQVKVIIQWDEVSFSQRLDYKLLNVQHQKSFSETCIVSS